MEPIASSRRWVAAVATIAAAAGLFWAFGALPFQDLPAHAGLMALRARLASSPFEQRFFVLAPHLGPYSFFRATGDALVEPLGPVGAVRFLMTLPVVALPAALGWARHRLHGDGALAATSVGICLTLGFMTILGFASYLLGLAALVVAYALWLDPVDDPNGPGFPSLAAECAAACAATAVLLVHGYAFGIFLALAGAASWAQGRSWRTLVRLRALVPATLLAAFMLAEDRAQGSAPVPSAGMPPGAHFAGLWDKLGLLCTPTLMTRWGVDLALGLGLSGLLALAVVETVRGAPKRTGGRIDGARLRALLAGLAVLGAAFLALPRAVGWFGFVDGRLVPLFLILATLAVDTRSMSRWTRAAWDRATPVAAMALVAIAWAASFAFQAEAAGWREVVAAIPAEAFVLNLPLDPDSDVFTAHPFVHYDKLAVLAKAVVVSDVWFHQGTALYPTSEHPALRLPAEYSESNLQRIDWSCYHLQDWDYVLLRTKPRADRPRVPWTLELVVHAGGWWLFATHARSSESPESFFAFAAAASAS
jgi:hypothetical protein